jgi:hypothetical protein
VECGDFWGICERGISTEAFLEAFDFSRTLPINSPTLQPFSLTISLKKLDQLTSLHSLNSPTETARPEQKQRSNCSRP